MQIWDSCLWGLKRQTVSHSRASDWNSKLKIAVTFLFALRRFILSERSGRLLLRDAHFIFRVNLLSVIFWNGNRKVWNKKPSSDLRILQSFFPNIQIPTCNWCLFLACLLFDSHLKFRRFFLLGLRFRPLVWWYTLLPSHLNIIIKKCKSLTAQLSKKDWHEVQYFYTFSCQLIDFLSCGRSKKKPKKKTKKERKKERKKNWKTGSSTEIFKFTCSLSPKLMGVSDDKDEAKAQSNRFHSPLVVELVFFLCFVGWWKL